MEAVGYEMYLRILEEAVSELRGEAQETVDRVPCKLDLPIDAHIPEDYIRSLPQRLGIYRRIAEIRNQADAGDIIDELLDRFGTPPPAALGLVNIATLRSRAEDMHITEIRLDGHNLLFYPTELDPAGFAALTERFAGRVKLSAKGRTHLVLRTFPGDDLARVLGTALEVLANGNNTAP
jgi:transcription-repair coupling factor (superfamily II helicase)